MAIFEHGPVRLNYEIEGDGFPVLLLAPGGMRSSNAIWNRMPWNPRTALRDTYRVIGMDQRNAGGSFAPVSAGDDWSTFTADQLALLDHLGVEQCHVVGMCIGGPFILGLLATAPDRFRSAVLLQPAGIDADEDNHEVHATLFDQWAAEVAADHPEAQPSDWAAVRDSLWGGDFILSVTREQVAACPTPMLVLLGNDQYHPASLSREIAALAPNATLIEHWKDESVLPETDATITAFLAEHTPA